MKKGKRKLYFGHGVRLEQSPSEDDFRSDRRKDTAGEALVKAGCSTTQMPPPGRKKKEGRLLRKSSTKRKLLENSSLSLQIGMENDNGDSSEMIQKKSGKSGSRSKKGTDNGNMSERKEGNGNGEIAQIAPGNLVESEASDYDFSNLYEAASHKMSQNHRHISKGPDMRGSRRNDSLVIGADKDAGVGDSVESDQKSSQVSEQLHGSQNRCDDAREASGTQEMFITQRDPKRKPGGLSPPLAASRNLMGEDGTRRMKSTKKQHHLTVSKVKQLNRSNITKAVMARHSCCPKKLPVSCISQNKNQDRVRAERFLRKVKELQEKRKIAGSQLSSFEQSPGDSQLSPSRELSESPQEFGSGTQMFSVSCKDPEPVETESQSLIPPMVADDDSEEESEEDTFKEVLAMRLARKKQRRRRNSRGIFGWSSLEEIQEDEIGDGEFVEDVTKSDEDTGKEGDYPEARSQYTLGKKEADLSQEPAVKEGIGSTAEEDVDVGSLNSPKVNCSVSPISCDIASKLTKGLLFSTKKEDQLKTGKESSTRKKDVIVLETQSEKIEPEIGKDETVPQKNDVTLVPDSHDLSGSSLPRYHFTSDDDSSNDLHDESVTQAVSKFLDTFEDCGDDRPPWEEADGQGSKPGATKEKKKDKTSDTFKGPEQVKDSGQDNSGSGKSDLGSSKHLEENADGCILGGRDEHFDDIDELDEVALLSGPVTKKKAKSVNKEVTKKFSRRLNMSEDGKRSDTNLLKEGRKLPVETSTIFVRADVHAVDIPTVREEASNHSGSITSGHKENPSTVNSSQSRSHEEIVCPMEASKSNTGKGTTVDVANVSTDPGDSSQETCLPEDYDNVGSVAQETLSPGSRCDKSGELGEREMLLREVSSSADAVCEVAASLSSGVAGRLVDNSAVELAVTSPGKCGKCKRVKSRTTYTQTDITMQNLQSQDYFDFCMEFKRLLLEYDKSVITTSGSGSFGSSTSDSDSRDNSRRKDLVVLARRVCDLEVSDKTLSSDEVTYERQKRRKKRKMVDSSCQMGSPSKGLDKSESKMHSEKVSTQKENLSENFANLNVDTEEFGGVMDTSLNERENCYVDMDGDVSSGNENLSGENYSPEWKKQKLEKGKSKKAKKRKKNDENENLDQTKKKKKVSKAEPIGRKKEKLADRKTKRKKKKKLKAETSSAGRKKKVEKDETKNEKKIDDTEDLLQTTKEKKAKNSEQNFSVLNIPIESIPSPEEVEQQWKEKNGRKRRKNGKKTGGHKLRRNRKVVNYRELSSSSSDNFGEASGLEKELLKKKRKLKKKGKDSEVVKTWKQRVVEGDLSSEVEEEFDRMEQKGVSGIKRKKVHKHKKKKQTSDDSGDQAFQDTLTREASLLPSPLELQLQYYSSDDTLS